MDGHLKRELKQYEKRKTKAQDRGDLEEEAIICSAVGELLAQHGHYEDSIKEHKQALQIYDSKNDAIGSAVAHRMVGECLCALGKYKQALNHQNMHLKLAKASNNIVEQQRAWATIGRTWFVYSDSATDVGQTEHSLIEAQKAYLESLSLCDELQGSVTEKELLEMRSRLYLNLGLVYDSKNDTSNARKFINQAIKIASDQKLLETEFRCYYCLGGVLAKVGMDIEASNAYNHAVQIARKNGQKLDEADALVQHGQVFLKLGEFLSARRTLKKAYKLTISKGAGDLEGLKPNFVNAIKGLKLINRYNALSEGKESEKAKVLDQLGDIYSNVKSFHKALECYEKELGLARSEDMPSNKLSPIYVSLAMTYSDLGQPSKAVQCYMEELNTIEGNYKGMCDTWCNVAEVYETSKSSYEKVEEAYFSALQYAEKANKVHLQIRVRKQLAEAQKSYDKLDLYQDSIKKIDQLESEFGIQDNESDDGETGDEENEEQEDDDVIIEREMNIPESDDDEDSDNDSSTTRQRGRATRTKLSKVNEKGETPLHRAAIAGDTQLVATLIDQGADVNARDYCGWQPLHEACNHGHLEAARVLVAKGASVNDPGGAHCQGVTPLHDAAQNGHIEIVRLLVEHGASLLNRDKQGKSPLDSVIAAQRSEEDHDLGKSATTEAVGRREVVRYLRRLSNSNNKHSITARDIPNRNRLLLEDKDVFDDDVNNNGNKDIDNNADDNSDDDDDDDIQIPTQSKFKERLQKRAKMRERERHRPSIESDDDDDDGGGDDDDDDDDDDISPEPLVSSFTSGSVSSTARSTRLPLENQIDSPIDHDASSENDSANENSPSIQYNSDDDVDDDSNHVNPSILHDTLSSAAVTRETSPQSRVPQPDSTITFVDPVHGHHTESRESQAVPALISERDLEYAIGATVSDDSDWLIDDLAGRPLKRRRTTKQATLGKSLSLSRKRPVGSGLPKKTSRSHGSGAINRTSKPKQTRLEVVRTPSPTFGTFPDTPSYHDHYLPTSTPSHQRPSGSSFSTSIVTTLSQSRPPGSLFGTQVNSTAVNANPPMRVRVQIQGKTFLIPCPESSDGERKTIAWLAEQAKLRYFTAYGLRPVLVLQTSEGAILSPEDNISDVLSNNEQVIASLESWDLPPLAERYKTACLSNNSRVKKSIHSLLQADPQISVVSLGNLALTSSDVLPLTRALQCHDRLVKLILPGNRIGDCGLQHIANCLDTLPNLSVLDIQCNGLTTKGVTYLLTAVSNDQQEVNTPSKLEELNLSYNPLTDTCCSSLASMLVTCQYLSSLHLQSVCMSGKVFGPGRPLTEAIKGSRLRCLDFSYNNIRADGLVQLVSILPSTLNHLNVSSSMKTNINVTVVVERLVEFMNKDDCALHTLLMSNCFLTSKHACNLTGSQCFQKSMRTLDVSCNNLGDDDDLARSLCQSRCQAVSLDLHGNKEINVEFLGRFLQYLSSCSSSLLSINLSSCAIGCISSEVLQRLKNCNQNLEMLDLSFCGLTSEDKRLLIDAWSVGNSARVATMSGPFFVLSGHQR